MGYVRISIHLRNGEKRSGVRAFSEPMNLEDIRQHAWTLSSEVLGRGAIEDVVVKEVPPTDSAVVALILREQQKKKPVPRRDGEHPYVRQMQRRPLR